MLDPASVSRALQFVAIVLSYYFDMLTFFLNYENVSFSGEMVYELIGPTVHGRTAQSSDLAESCDKLVVAFSGMECYGDVYELKTGNCRFTPKQSYKNNWSYPRNILFVE